ncbi:ABC transporter ATP-binding protein [Lysinibacillus sp. NPDC094403]|uniref:ABC transporter ATP-binding protein n=1 Tax=Lysinibacillus sp. NPDC094403 TaxID=3390581 RepID=UPI003CFF6CD6
MEKKMIEITNLTKEYNESAVVSNVSMTIKKGRVYGLLGRNGAGKTTIMKMILGLIEPSNGEIKILGKSLKGHEKELYPKIGSIIETPSFYPNLTGTENLQIFARLRGVDNKEIQKVLTMVNLPYKDKKVFGKYSLGMKQRLGIANAIMHNPDLLILDEPTNGLDPIGISEVRDLLKKMCEREGKTILISSHILSEIELLVDDIGIINSGNLLVEDTLHNIRQQNRSCLVFKVKQSDVEKSKLILAEKLAISDYVERDGQFKIYEAMERFSEINKAFVSHDITILSTENHKPTLEEYFIRVTGGEGIG